MHWLLRRTATWIFCRVLSLHLHQSYTGHQKAMSFLPGLQIAWLGHDTAAYMHQTLHHRDYWHLTTALWTTSPSWCQKSRGTRPPVEKSGGRRPPASSPTTPLQAVQGQLPSGHARRQRFREQAPPPTPGRHQDLIIPPDSASGAFRTVPVGGTSRTRQRDTVRPEPELGIYWNSPKGGISTGVFAWTRLAHNFEMNWVD